MPAKREELLEIDGTSRIILERRVRDLVRVFDAATELVASDDACLDALHEDALTEEEQFSIEDRYEKAWEKLRAELKSI